MKRLAVIVIVIATVFGCWCGEALGVAGTNPDITAQGATVLEVSTNTVLYSKSAHEKLSMASTTKVMTALVAVTYGNVSDMVQVCDEAYGVEGSSIYLEKNEKISLQDLLYGLMLRSGNDAAVAIASHVGGSVENFVKMMNDMAGSLGAHNTHFVNPNGLPAEEHYTTSYDLALICAQAMKNEMFNTIVSTQYYTASTGAKSRVMMNKNKLLWDYEGALGIKTGYTIAAGKCLTFAAKRGSMVVVGTVLNCPNMFPDAMKLMDYAFDNYEMYNIVAKNTPVISVEVDNRADELLSLVADNSLAIPVKKTDGAKVTPQIKIANSISAPIVKGQELGTLELYIDDRAVGKCLLVAARDVYPPTIGFYLREIFSAWCP